MKNCIVYGNCHIGAIRKYLMSSESFNKIYKMIHVPPVQECNRETGLDKEVIKNCDLFIYQRISDSFGPYLSTDYLLSQLPAKCISISFANAYFQAYYPQFAVDPFFLYGDTNVTSLLSEGKSKEQILSIVCDDEFYSFNELSTMVDTAINELRSRETNIDIPIADYIERHYREKHLFYTINHPNYHICRYLTKKMLVRLGLPENEISNIVYDQEFSNVIHPIYPSVIKQLDLRFLSQDYRYSLGWVYLPFKEYIAQYIDYLQSSN